MYYTKLNDSVIIESNAYGSPQLRGIKVNGIWEVRVCLFKQAEAVAICKFINNEPHKVFVYHSTSKTSFKVFKRNAINYEVVHGDWKNFIEKFSNQTTTEKA